MSCVTNIILTHSIGELDPIYFKVYPIHMEINKFLGSKKAEGLKSVNKYAGGFKCLECEVLIGTANGIYEDEFLAHLRSLPWVEPKSVQVFLQGPDEDKFRVYDLLERG